MIGHRVLGTLAALLVVGLSLGEASAQPQPGRPKESPSATASPRSTSSDEVSESYRKVLQQLDARRVQDHAAEVTFRFSPLEGPSWPRIRLKEIRATARGPAVILEGDGREYLPGDLASGARLVIVTADEAVFEFNGEKRKFSTRRVFPVITVRSIRQIEGEWTVFLDEEKRAFYRGDTYREVKILAIEPDGVVLQSGTEYRKIAPKAVRKPFPDIAFTGVIEMGGGRVAFVKGRSDPARVGDTIQGARVVDISPSAVTLEFEGEVRPVPIR